MIMLWLLPRALEEWDIPQDARDVIPGGDTTLGNVL